MTRQGAFNRRELLGGMVSLGLLALFRPRKALDQLVELPEEISEEQIIEEYLEYPSAIDIVVMASATFRSRRLVVPTNIAPLWILEDIFIGKRPQTTGPIPASVFVPTAIDMDTMMDVAGPGTEIKLRVRRSGPIDLRAKPEIFRAAIMGDIDGGAGSSIELYPGGPIVPTRSRRMTVLPFTSDPYQVLP